VSRAFAQFPGSTPPALLLRSSPGAIYSYGRAGCSSKDNFRNDGGVKNSPMPALEFTKTFVILRNPDFKASGVREFDILGTPMGSVIPFNMVNFITD
jgi:hypothetical protein